MTSNQPSLRILVVDDGAIADSGKHGDLILRCQAYRKIWQSQDYGTPPFSIERKAPIGARYRKKHAR